jgi:galactofuranosylgalactofuranosylrhamnosyl-N-acetylglucosaminyl-diphospho-decaprenol beta-1,5/1,6-galactofuranosyltransferase
MQVLAKLNIPKSEETRNLYIRCNEGASINFSESQPEIVLNKGGMLSSNTYFNSFYEQYYAKYTNLNSVYYLLKLEGDFQISIYRELYGEDNKTLLSEASFKSCQLSDYVKIALPDLVATEKPGRIYLKIVCLSETGKFRESLIATEPEANREVSLAIISCTFKKEIYIKKTVNTILQDELLANKNFKIFVVDNGKTLTQEELADSRIELIPNRNVGGSGGFTRGLMAALEENTYTHFLFMDDDVEVESETFYRLFSLYEYAKEDFAISGSMIDLYKKHLLHEAGATYGKPSAHVKFGPFSASPLKHDLNLQEPSSLNVLLWEEPIDFGGFWFFAFSKEVVEKIGLPLPLFIKVDDIEFGLRIIKDANLKIVAFPSIAVWHEPFYAKFPVWDNYYNSRNHLIANAIHGSLSYPEIISEMTKALMFCLMFFEYNSAEMIVKGLEDYLQGPDFLKNNDPEKLHSEILKQTKTYNTQKLEPNYLPAERYVQNSTPGILPKVVSLLTINGHLLPDFLTTGEVFIWQGKGYSGQRSRALGKKKVFLFKEESAFLLENELDKKAGIKILAKWFSLAAKSITQWSSIRQQWRDAAKYLTSNTFWQEYLRLNDRVKV